MSRRLPSHPPRHTRSVAELEVVSRRSRLVKPGHVTLDSRSVRIVIGVGVTFLVWMLLTMRLNHRCLLGYKWFEHFSPLVVGIFSAATIVFVRRLWLGSILAVAIALAFFQFVIPPYLDWIHGPNHPYFPAAEATRARMLNDPRLIEIPIDTAPT